MSDSNFNNPAPNGNQDGLRLLICGFMSVCIIIILALIGQCKQAHDAGMTVQQYEAAQDATTAERAKMVKHGINPFND